MTKCGADLLSFVVILMAASGAPSFPEEYGALITCATAYGQKVDLISQSATKIAKQAEASCMSAYGQEFESARRALTAQANGNADDADAYLRAKLRYHAYDALLTRVEQGEPVGSIGTTLDTALQRYRFCIGAAVMQRTESFYFGDNWTVDIQKKGRSEIEEAHRDLVTRHCGKSQILFLTEFRAMLSDGGLKPKEIDAEITSIKDAAIKPYVDVAMDVGRKTTSR